MTIISPASKLQSKISMKMKIIFPITLDICTIPRASKSPYPKKTLAVKNKNLMSLFPLTFSLQFLYDTTGTFSKDFFSQGAVYWVFLGLFHYFFY